MNKSCANFQKISYLFNSFILRNVRKYNNLPLMPVIKNKSVPSILLTAAGVNLINLNNDDVQDMNQVENVNESSVQSVTAQIKNACDISGDKLKELLHVIKISILKSCQDYRNCLQKQIEILKKGMKTDPLSEYWDEMVKHRVEADNLKLEINKIYSILDYVGQIIYNLNICQTLLDNIGDTASEIDQELKQLKEICNEQNNLNKDIESELLKLDRLYIMFTQ